MDALAPNRRAAEPLQDGRLSPPPWPRWRDLRAPIDRFFDEVTVNADEENKRAQPPARPACAHPCCGAKVADFSKIEG